MLKDTLSKFFKVDTLLDNLSGYVETRVELLKVEAREEVAGGLAKGIAYLLVAFVLALFVAFTSVAIALLLSATLGLFVGFAIVAGFYLLLGIILWLWREKLIARLSKRFEFMFRKKQ